MNNDLCVTIKKQKDSIEEDGSCPIDGIAILRTKSTGPTGFPELPVPVPGVGFFMTVQVVMEFFLLLVHSV